MPGFSLPKFMPPSLVKNHWSGFYHITTLSPHSSSLAPISYNNFVVYNRHYLYMPKKESITSWIFRSMRSSWQSWIPLESSQHNKPSLFRKKGSPQELFRKHLTGKLETLGCL